MFVCVLYTVVKKFLQNPLTFLDKLIFNFYCNNTENYRLLSVLLLQNQSWTGETFHASMKSSGRPLQYMICCFIQFKKILPDFTFSLLLAFSCSCSFSFTTCSQRYNPVVQTNCCPLQMKFDVCVFVCVNFFVIQKPSVFLLVYPTNQKSHPFKWTLRQVLEKLLDVVTPFDSWHWCKKSIMYN